MNTCCLGHKQLTIVSVYTFFWTYFGSCPFPTAVKQKYQLNVNLLAYDIVKLTSSKL